MRLEKASFAIFDVETTGLYPYSGDRICEIAAIRFALGSRKTERFHSLIDPGRPISEGAFMVNRITAQMVRGKPGIEEVLPGFLKFIEGNVLVAYNAGFDLGFLECALGGNRHILDDYRVIDALALARRLFPGIGGYSLATVASALGISSSKAHRAMSDTIMTLGVFKKELSTLESRGAKTLDDISAIQRRRTVKIEAVKDYKIQLIEEAIREEKRLSITYYSSWNNKTTKRVVTPKEIQEGFNTSYLIAHCHLRDAERNFKLDGILDAKLEGDT